MLRACWCGNTGTTKVSDVVGPGWYFLHTIPSTMSSCDQSWAYLLNGGFFPISMWRALLRMECIVQLKGRFVLLLCLPYYFCCEASMHCGQGCMECFPVWSSPSRQCISISVGRSLPVHDFKAELLYCQSPATQEALHFLLAQPLQGSMVRH